ncbi:MAG: STAS domain-containing protein [Nitrospirae bacterium]|nr:STAS domain-containing protein [Nitrospirota bacterium]
MAITSKVTDGNSAVLQISGRFDINDFENFSETSKTLINKGVKKYIVDLSETEYLDSSALGMLLLLRERVGGDEADITIVNASSEVKKILTISNFQRLFKLE